MLSTEPKSVGSQSEPEGECDTWVRCFLAVPLAEPALGAAQRLQSSLQEQVPGIRWARPDTLHLTVHFFGSIEAARATAAVDLVTPIARRTTPFHVDLDRIGVFPSPKAPRVLWLGPAHAIAPLTALALECRSALAAAGFEIEARPYRAHCTLGRPRSAWDDRARTAWEAAVREHHTDVHFTASRLVLYESRPAPGGALHTERSSSAFAAR